MEWLEAERIDTPNTHGTGCMLSAAIAAYLARGDAARRAVRAGKAFVTEAIRHALPSEAGSGPSITCGGRRRRTKGLDEASNRLEQRVVGERALGDVGVGPHP